MAGHIFNTVQKIGFQTRSLPCWAWMNIEAGGVQEKKLGKLFKLHWKSTENINLTFKSLKIYFLVLLITYSVLTPSVSWAWLQIHFLQFTQQKRDFTPWIILLTKHQQTCYFAAHNLSIARVRNKYQMATSKFRGKRNDKVPSSRNHNFQSWLGFSSQLPEFYIYDWLGKTLFNRQLWLQLWSSTR